MRNFHLPLPEETFANLRAEAGRTGTPLTVTAREAIEWWLKEQKRRHRHEQIFDYARRAGGSPEDLDPALEAAGIDHLLKMEKSRNSK